MTFSYCAKPKPSHKGWLFLYIKSYVLPLWQTKKQMEFDLKNIDCDKMLLNPKSPRLVSFMEKNIPALKKANVEYQDIVFTKSMVYRYILLMYDPNSEIANMQQLEWFAKKYEACGYAGFKLKKANDGYFRFDKRVDEMVMGKITPINDMIIEFLGWINKAKWNYLVFLHESMLALTRDSVGRKITKHKSSQDYMKLYDDYYKISNEIGRTFDETEEFVSRFYHHIETSRLAIRPEDYARALADNGDLRGDSPYTVGYVVDKIRFLGDDPDKA